MKHEYRPMTPRDVVVGQRFLMVGDEGLYRGTIEEVLHPEDMWNAFVAQDGCRYGLEGSYIIIKKTK